MKDLFDEQTNDMGLEQLVPKRPGRQGKIINQSNFFHVLDYFLEKADYPPIELREIKKMSPPAYYSGVAITNKIKQYERWISEAEDLPGRVELDGSTAGANASLAKFKDELDKLKKLKQEIPENLIVRLQVWVKLNVKSDEWTRCLNLAARQRADAKNRKRSISIEEETFNIIKRIKLKHHANDWDHFLLDMARLYEQKQRDN